MRAQPDLADLVVHLVRDPGLDEVLGEDPTLDQELVVGLQRGKGLLQAGRDEAEQDREEDADDDRDRQEPDHRPREDVDLLVTDCLRREEHPTHASLATALKFARRTRARTTVLTHLDKSMDYATVSAEIPENVLVGYDGMEIELT